MDLEKITQGTKIEIATICRKKAMDIGGICSKTILVLI